MPLWVKTNTGSTPWVKAKTLWVKTNTGSTPWSAVKSAYVKTSAGIGGWKKFFPTTGPYAENFPSLSSDSAGNTFPVYVYIGTMPNPNAVAGTGNVYVQKKLYGHVGDWNPNGYTISNFDYGVSGFSDGTTDLGAIALYTSTTPLTVSNTTSTDPKLTGDKTSTTIPEILLDATYDSQWLAFTVTANTTTKDSSGAYISGSDSSDEGNNGRILAVKHEPVNLSVSMSASTYGSGSTFSVTSYWQTADGYSIDPNRTKYAWYKSTSASYTTLAQLQSNATSLGNSSSSYIASSSDVGYYIYGVVTCYNGGSDYFNNGVGVSAVAKTSQTISLGVTQITAPTLVAKDSSGNVKTTGITATDKFYFTPGTYSNYSYVGTYVQWGSTLASASSVQSGYVGYDGSSPHTISNAEASAQYYFIVRDIVIGNDSNTYNFFGNSYRVVQSPTNAPTFYPNSGALGGFIGGVNNYSANNSYSASLISTTSTSTPTFTWGTSYSAGGYYLFTVSNMSPGSSATYRITVTTPGYASNYADTTGTAPVAPDPFSYSVSSATVTPDAPGAVTITDNGNNTFYISWAAVTSSNIAFYSVNYSGVVSGASASYTYDGTVYPMGGGPRRTPNISFTTAGNEDAYVRSFGNVTGANINVSTTNNATSWLIKYNITGNAAGAGTYTQTATSMPYFVSINAGNSIAVTSVQASNSFYSTTGSAGTPTSVTPGIGSNRTDATTTALAYALPAPVKTADPAVTPATVYLGNTATTTNGSWTGASSYGYQWRSASYGGFYNGSNTPSTNSTYVVSAGDVYNLNGSLYCLVTAYAGANKTGNNAYAASNTVATQIADTPSLSQSGTTWTFSNTSNNVTSYSWCVASTNSTSAISYNFLNGASGVTNTWSATSGNTVYSQGTGSSITVNSTGRYIHVIAFVKDPVSLGYYASPRGVSAATTIPVTPTAPTVTPTAPTAPTVTPTAPTAPTVTPTVTPTAPTVTPTARCTQKTCPDGTCTCSNCACPI